MGLGEWQVANAGVELWLFNVHTSFHSDICPTNCIFSYGKRTYISVICGHRTTSDG